MLHRILIDNRSEALYLEYQYTELIVNAYSDQPQQLTQHLLVFYKIDSILGFLKRS